MKSRMFRRQSPMDFPWKSNGKEVDKLAAEREELRAILRHNDKILGRMPPFRPPEKAILKVYFNRDLENKTDGCLICNAAFVKVLHTARRFRQIIPIRLCRCGLWQPGTFPPHHSPTPSRTCGRRWVASGQRALLSCLPDSPNSTRQLDLLVPPSPGNGRQIGCPGGISCLPF